MGLILYEGVDADDPLLEVYVAEGHELDRVGGHRWEAEVRTLEAGFGHFIVVDRALMVPTLLQHLDGLVLHYQVKFEALVGRRRNGTHRVAERR